MKVLLPVIRRFEALFNAYEEHGFELYFVGGCVRDAIMGASRADFDLATNALPDESTHALRKAGFKVFPIGARFGTVATIIDGVTVEITTYRVAETYEPGNRKPEVEFGNSLHDDLSRRDLSINAMAVGRDGEVVDPYDGQQAIVDERLEVPGGGYENTISILSDDPLRLLRIARFAARLCFTPTDETTRAACVTADKLHDISRERWKMEMDKLMVAADPAFGLRWLAEVRALDVIFPRATDARHAGTLEWILGRVQESERDAGLRWAVLALGLTWARWSGKLPNLDAPRSDWPSDAERRAVADEIAQRFRLSNAEQKRLQRMVALPFHPDDLKDSWTAPRLRRWWLAYGDDAFGQIDIAFALASRDELRWAIHDLRDQLRGLLEREDPTPNLPKGLGKRVIDALELEPGPAIADAMQRIRDAIIDEQLPNGADAQVYVDWLIAQ